MVGQITDQALELAAAKRRIRELETELAVSRKVKAGLTEVVITAPSTPVRLTSARELLGRKIRRPRDDG